MQKDQIFLLILLLIPLFSNSKVVIFTYAYNQPEFIELQHKTFQKFLKDDYDFIVFSDASTEDMHVQIKIMCDKYNLKCIRIPQEIHNRPYLDRPIKIPYVSNFNSASVRNCNVVQYSLDTLGFYHNDILVLIDSDLFLVKDFSIRKYLKGYHLAGFHRPCKDFDCGHNCEKEHPNYSGIEHIWIGLVFIDMAHLPHKEILNFNCGKVWCENNITMNLDSGGYTYYYMKYVPTAKIKKIERINLKYEACEKCWQSKKVISCSHNTYRLKEFGLSNIFINFLQKLPYNFQFKYRESELFLGETFFHLKGGMSTRPLAKQKMEIFKSFLKYRI